jgi:hypothetical protein
MTRPGLRRHDMNGRSHGPLAGAVGYVARRQFCSLTEGKGSVTALQDLSAAWPAGKSAGFGYFLFTTVRPAPLTGKHPGPSLRTTLPVTLRSAPLVLRCPFMFLRLFRLELRRLATKRNRHMRNTIGQAYAVRSLQELLQEVRVAVRAACCLGPRQA